MDNSKLSEEIKAIVNSIFAEKEETDKQRLAEEAISKSATTISNLTSTLETRNAEYETLVAANDQANEKVTTLTASVETLETEKQDLATKLASAEEQLTALKTEHETLKASNDTTVAELTTAKEALANIEKEKVTTARYEALKVANVTLSDKDKQLAKIKDMTDEEFEAYKSELIAIREDVVAQLKPPTTTDTTATVDTTVVLAQVDQTSAGALNVDGGTAPSVKDRYKALGQAFADRMKKTEN